MPIPHRRLSDPRDLTALAHPVRMGIVELLSIAGPLTATELADRLGESPANCSWHLRKLAEHDFVEEAGGGRGRRRPWRVPGLGFTWTDADATPELHRAAQALSEVVMGRAIDRLREAHERLPQETADWQAATSVGSEHAIWLTAAGLAELNAALAEVLDRFAERLTEPDTRPPGSRLCEFVTWGVPTYFPGIEPVPPVIDGAEGGAT